MKWNQEAEAAISRVPFFVRRRVKKRVEEEAVRQGVGTVEMAHVVSCRNRFLKDMSSEVKGYQLETCFGSAGCPNRVAQKLGFGGTTRNRAGCAGSEGFFGGSGQRAVENAS